MFRKFMNDAAKRKLMERPRRLQLLTLRVTTLSQDNASTSSSESGESPLRNDFVQAPKAGQFETSKADASTNVPDHAGLLDTGKNLISEDSPSTSSLVTMNMYHEHSDQVSIPFEHINYCCIPRCGSDSTTIQVRQFPVYDKRLRKKWLEMLPLTDLEFAMTISKKSFRYVCYRHFDSSQFSQGADGKRYLTRKAVPTLVRCQRLAQKGASGFNTSNMWTTNVSSSSSSTSSNNRHDRFYKDFAPTKSNFDLKSGPSYNVNKKSGIARFCDIQRSATASARYTCMADGMAFDDVSLAWDHLKDVHDLQENSGRVGCGDCSRRFKSILGLKKHVDQGHNTVEAGEFKCDVCGKQLSSQIRLVRHKRRIHVSKLEGTKMNCEICGIVLASKGSLQQHMLLHKPGRSYECKKCGKKYKQAVGLHTHKRDAHSKTKFTCKTCGKVLSGYHSLCQHMLLHKPGRKYECSECGKKFKQAPNYYAHRRQVHKIIGRREVQAVQAAETKD